MIQHQDNSVTGCCSSRPSSSQPGWLWLEPQAWASKLSSLQLHVPLVMGPASLVLQELTGLQRLAITGACLRPSEVQTLLQHLGSCAALTGLVLAGNDMCLLPEQGWQSVTGLKVGPAAGEQRPCVLMLEAAMVQHGMMRIASPSL